MLVVVCVVPAAAATVATGYIVLVVGCVGTYGCLVASVAPATGVDIGRGLAAAANLRVAIVAVGPGNGGTTGALVVVRVATNLRIARCVGRCPGHTRIYTARRELARLTFVNCIAVTVT